MDSHNLNVLVEAKEQYLGQLCDIMMPFMNEVFAAMYNESVKASKGKKVLIQFQKFLKEVPNWNNHMVTQHTDKLCSSCGWFNDLLAAVFVSFVKILSSVRLSSQNKKISIKLPSNQVFVHGCYINAAKDIYKDPYVYQDEVTENERDEIMFNRFSLSIKNSVKEMIPIQQILTTYISQGEHKEVNLSTEPDEDSEDPDLHDDEAPEPEEEEVVEEDPTEPEEVVEEEPPETSTSTSIAPDLDKIIPVSATTPVLPTSTVKATTPVLPTSTVTEADDDGVLFPGAPE